MAEIDYVAERGKLLEELRHHHVYPEYIAIERNGSPDVHWRVGSASNEWCPTTWAGAPIEYVAEDHDIPRRDTRDWVRRENPLR
jgi:hypothetical protein